MRKILQSCGILYYEGKKHPYCQPVISLIVWEPNCFFCYFRANKGSNHQQLKIIFGSGKYEIYNVSDLVLKSW